MHVSAFVGTSVDGFIARANGALDWLPPEGNPNYEAFMATVDAIVVGRNTYDTVLGFDTWPYGKKPVIVLSTHPFDPPPREAAAEAMTGEPGEIVQRLANRGIQHCYVDGGIVIQSFLRAGCIGRLVITRVPVLIGSGVPLFGPLEHDIALEHVATCHLSNGLVQTEYMVVGRQDVPDDGPIAVPPDAG